MMMQCMHNYGDAHAHASAVITWPMTYVIDFRLTFCLDMATVDILGVSKKGGRCYRLHCLGSPTAHCPNTLLVSWTRLLVARRRWVNSYVLVSSYFQSLLICLIYPSLLFKPWPSHIQHLNPTHSSSLLSSLFMKVSGVQLADALGQSLYNTGDVHQVLELPSKIGRNIKDNQTEEEDEPTSHQITSFVWWCTSTREYSLETGMCWQTYMLQTTVAKTPPQTSRS